MSNKDRQYHIRKKFIFLHQEQLGDFFKYAEKSLKKHFGENVESEGSLSELFMHIIRNEELVEIETKQKCSLNFDRSFIFYISDLEMEELTEYIAKNVYSKLKDGDCKKKSSTMFFINSLKKYSENE